MMGSCGGCVATTLPDTGGHVGSMPRTCWGHVEVISVVSCVGSCWGYVGSMLANCGVMLGPFWDHGWLLNHFRLIDPSHGLQDPIIKSPNHRYHALRLVSSTSRAPQSLPRPTHVRHHEFKARHTSSQPACSHDQRAGLDGKQNY